MTQQMLNLEAKSAAKAHAAVNGGGRAFGIEWGIRVHERGATLVVTYICNRPNGHCGRYETTVAL